MTVEQFPLGVDPVTGKAYYAICVNRDEVAPTASMSAAITDINNYISANHSGATSLTTTPDLATATDVDITNVVSASIVHQWQWMQALRLATLCQTLRLTGHGWIATIICG